jgi:hypothetical protein
MFIAFALRQPQAELALGVLEELALAQELAK